MSKEESQTYDSPVVRTKSVKNLIKIFQPITQQEKKTKLKQNISTNKSILINTDPVVHSNR